MNQPAQSLALAGTNKYVRNNELSSFRGSASESNTLSSSHLLCEHLEPQSHHAPSGMDTHLPCNVVKVQKHSLPSAPLTHWPQVVLITHGKLLIVLFFPQERENSLKSHYLLCESKRTKFLMHNFQGRT